MTAADLEESLSVTVTVEVATDGRLFLPVCLSICASRNVIRNISTRCTEEIFDSNC